MNILMQIRSEVAKEMMPEIKKSLGKKYKVRYRNNEIIISSKPSGEMQTRKF